MYCNIEARSRNHCCRAKTRSVTNSEQAFVNYDIQHEKLMRLIILPSVACPAAPCFAHYLTRDTIFGRKLLNTKCVFRFSVQILSETFLILTTFQPDITINVDRTSCDVHFFVRLKKIIIFKNFPKFSSVKFHENPSSGSPVVPCGRTDGQA